MLKVRSCCSLPENGSIVVKAGYPPEDVLDQADLAAAKWAWEHNRPAGRGSDTRCPEPRRLFLPMRTGRGRDRGGRPSTATSRDHFSPPDQRRLLDALIDQSALAIERVDLVDDLDQAKRRVEADRLRSALLTSISHDLKTSACRNHRRGRHAQELPERVD
jgi:two-component system sensor histidine kinase KdpD